MTLRNEILEKFLWLRSSEIANSSNVSSKYKAIYKGMHHIHTFAKTHSLHKLGISLWDS